MLLCVHALLRHLRYKYRVATNLQRQLHRSRAAVVAMAFSSAAMRPLPSPAAPPLIPGLVSTHQREAGRLHFRRGQLLERMAVGKPTSLPEPTSLAVAFSNTQAAPSSVVQSAKAPGRGLDVNCTGSTFKENPTQPAWIAHDRQVLRFFGYFVERGDSQQPGALGPSQGPEPSQEAVRRVVVCFHLSDRSLAISEPRVANSGRVQGAFLKRSVLTKPSNSGLQARPELFSPSDFRVGGELRVCGRVIHLVDCDEATRAFYREDAGLQPVASPRKYPDDPLDVAAEEVAAIRDRLRARGKKQSESAAERARKFHELSGKVLRFSAVWRDPHPLYPRTLRLALLYYLSDDTLELLELEPRPTALGTDANAPTRSRVLLSRRRIALERPGHEQSHDRSRRPEDAPQRFVTARDLRCGEWLRVFARDVFLEDCDPFTRAYYLEAMGVTQERFSASDAPSLPSSDPQPTAATKWALFRSKPGLETGDRAYHLRHDGGTSTNQRDALDGRQLRFRARFHGLRRDDPNAERQFVLTYFLEDDTLAVFEPKRSNPTGGGTSGGGRFLDRGRFRKSSRAELGDTMSREQQKQRSAYRADDFFVGAVICFEFSPNQRLELLEADVQTLAWCETHPEQFPLSDSNEALDQLAKATGSPRDGDDLLLSFRRVDNDASQPGTTRVSDALAVLSRLGLNAQQVLTLCRRFAASNERAVTTVFATSTPAVATPSNRMRRSGDGDEKLDKEPRVRYRALCDAVSARVAKALSPRDGNNTQAAAEAPVEGLRGKLLRVPNLRELLCESRDGRTNRTGDVWIPMAQFFQSTTAARVELDARDVQELVALGCVRNGRIDARQVWEFVQAGEPEGGRTNAVGLNTGRTHDDPLDEDDGWWSSDGPAPTGDSCEPPADNDTWASPRRTPRQPAEGIRSDVAPVTPMPVPPLRMAAVGLDAGRTHQPVTGNRTPTSLGASPRRSALSPPQLPRGASSSRVVALVQRVFGERKYQLRRALRERDRGKSGRLAEDDFMDAVLSVEPALSDDDTYLIADAYFPTNNCTVDYAELLERAFRTS